MKRSRPRAWLLAVVTSVLSAALALSPAQPATSDPIGVLRRP